MNESVNPIVKYFSEFKILKTVSKDFWLTNVVQFFDGMAYFSMITVFVLYLTDYCSFNDADAALWVGLYTCLSPPSCLQWVPSATSSASGAPT